MSSISLAVEDEVLRARVQLDAARARREAALGLAQRLFGGVEAAERHQPPSLSPAHASTRSLGTR